MDPNTVDPSKLFSVEGMVVVITGGGVSPLSNSSMPRQQLQAHAFRLALVS